MTPKARLATNQLHYPLLFLVLLLGFFFRVYQLHSLPPSIFIDEYNLANAAFNYWENGSQASWAGFNWYGTPEVFIRSLAFILSKIGFQSTNFRIIWGVMGLLLIPIIYKIALKINGKSTALIATSLLSFSVFHLHISRWGHGSVVNTTFFWLAVYGWLKAAKEQKLFWSIISAISFAAGLYSYVSMRVLLIFPVLMSWVQVCQIIRQILKNKKPVFTPQIKRQLFQLFFFWLILIILWLPQIKAGMADPVGFWGRAKELSILNLNKNLSWNLHELARSAQQQLKMFTNGFDPNLRHNPLKLTTFPLVTLIMMAIGFVKIILKKEWWNLSFFISILVANTLSGLLSGFEITIFRSQPLLPAVYILAGIGCSYLWQKARNITKLTAFTFLFIFVLVMFQPSTRVYSYFHSSLASNDSIREAFTAGEYLIARKSKQILSEGNNLYLSPDFYWFASVQYELKTAGLWGKARFFSWSQLNQIPPLSTLIIDSKYQYLTPYFRKLYPGIRIDNLKSNNNIYALVFSLPNSKADNSVLTSYGLSRHCQDKQGNTNNGIDPTLSLAWTTAEPVASAIFECAWQATINLHESGGYRFKYLADDKAQLTIKDLSNRVLARSKFKASDQLKINLRSGLYQIKIQYKNLGGAKRVELEMMGPSDSQFHPISPLILKPAGLR